MSSIKKVYFCIDRSGFCNEIGQWLIVAIRSVLANTHLKPVVIYTGENDANAKRLCAEGAEVIHCRSRLLPAITKGVQNGRLPQRTEGALLRYEIPSLCHEEEWILYADCDIYFARDPKIDVDAVSVVGAVVTPTTKGVAHYNSGVILMNGPRWRERSEDFFGFVERTLGNWLPSSVDEMAFNEFFRDEITLLPRELNWRPMFGYNDSADIVHFHGIKIHEIYCSLIRDFRGHDRSVFESGYIYELARHRANSLNNVVIYLSEIKSKGHLLNTLLDDHVGRLISAFDSEELTRRTIFLNSEMSMAAFKALKIAYKVDNSDGPWTFTRIKYKGDADDVQELKLHPCESFGAGRIVIRYTAPGGVRGLHVTNNTSMFIDVRIDGESEMTIYWSGVGIDCHVLIQREGGFPAGEELDMDIVSVSEDCMFLYARSLNGDLFNVFDGSFS